MVRPASRPSIRIAGRVRLCLAEGTGVLIRSRLRTLELFRVKRDKRQMTLRGTAVENAEGCGSEDSLLPGRTGWEKLGLYHAIRG
jgi:hypothetical protein